MNKQTPLFEAPQDNGSEESSVDTSERARQIADAALRHPSGSAAEPRSVAGEDQGWISPPPEINAESVEKKFTQRFSWIPHSKGEMLPALRGLEASIEERDRFGGLSGVKAARNLAQDSNGSALRNMRVMRQAFDVKDEMDSLSPSGILANEEVITVLGMHVLYKQALEAGKWPVNKRSNIEKKLSPIILDLRSSSDDKLLELWHETFSSESARSEFWRDQLNDVRNNPRLRMLEADEHQRAVS